MNRLSIQKRKQVIAALTEGVSINATVRLTGVSKPTILKLLRDLGAACAEFHDQHVRGLKPEFVQTDEIWSFNYCKQKNVAKAKAAPLGAGDIWTWTAIDAQTKLCIAYHVGLRTEAAAAEFMLDLAGRITNRTQLPATVLRATFRRLRMPLVTTSTMARLSSSLARKLLGRELSGSIRRVVATGPRNQGC